MIHRNKDFMVLEYMFRLVSCQLMLYNEKY